MAEKLNSPFITLVIGNKRYKLPKEFLCKCPQLQQQSFLTSEIALPDVYEDAGHTLVHFFYSGNYETILSPPDIDTCGIAGEYKRSVLVYHASRKCDIPGLECLAKHYVEHFGKELSLHDVLRLTRDVFSTLPEGETWLPNYIKSHLLRLKLGNPANNLAELYSTLGHDHQFDNTVMKMVVDMLSVNLSDNALREALWANGRCAAEEPAADEPAADEPAADEPAADEPAADEPAADEPAAEEPVAEEPAEEWIIPDASSVEGWPNAPLHPHGAPATENLSSASEAFIEAQPTQTSLTKISVADLALYADWGKFRGQMRAKKRDELARRGLPIPSWDGVVEFGF
ncbi:unnamed protein product [Penicillium salamii]|uniref:BTB domain-containing protein n=1 Tax=Penicillium salamii TaxID=1612424 RepID=A0A9W4NCG1_9EURO|nr:unnamed protein product [Penicillium salamii]